MYKHLPVFTAILIAAVLLPMAGALAEVQTVSGALANPVRREATHRVIVKFRERVAEAGAGAPGGRAMREVSEAAGTELGFVRDMAGGAKVFALPEALPRDEVESIAGKIARMPGVEYAEPDLRMHPLLTPNDPQYAGQWHLTDYLGGINAPAAWDISTGSINTVVAVLDSGRTAHPDLDDRMLPGYDFISDPVGANDTDGREADASDPGNWLTSAEKAAEPKFTDCTVRNSSWHGTLVAGVIGASTQNGRDAAGIDWATRILPVRVLGKCGGTTADIADAMMWAGGFSVPGVPDNPNPAKILNLSLGAEASCGNTYQNTINQLIAAGKIIIASAGNENNSADHSPASCQGVINVAATARSGSKASYSSFGGKVTLAAPGGDGGDLITLGNTGTTVPGIATVSGTSGTSFSAPVVSGIASLMLALRPDLDSAAVKRILTASVRPFPDTTCDTTICGAGIIDAAAALRSTRDQSIGVATFVGFQDADVGRPNPDVALRVTNLATTPTTINGGMLFTSTDSAIDFLPTANNTCANAPLATGSSCQITLRFYPSAKDMRRADLTLSASDGRNYRVSLAGFAYPAASISQQTAGTSGGPLYIAKAPDGSYWYTQTGGANRVARMTPTGIVTEFSLPNTGSTPFEITAGADGNMWFTELDGGRIGRITPAGAITEFPLPVATSQPRGITAGPDGNIWFTEIVGAKIGRITPQGVITEFDIPWAGATPRGITSGPDGNLWFTDSGGLSIGRVTPSGSFTRYSIPWASNSARGITTGPDGNLWFTESVGNRLGRITLAGVLTQFPLPRAGASPLGISAGPDGAVWYTAFGASRVGRIDTATGQITEYRLPSAGSTPIGIAIGPNNLMWIANSASGVNKIAKLSIAGVSGPDTASYQGLWWAGPGESGWGMSITQHSGILFAALYTYDDAGQPTWYVIPNCPVTTSSCAGDIYKVTGGTSPTVAWSEAGKVVVRVGTGTLAFADTRTATFNFTINNITGSKAITQQIFAAGTTPPAIDYTDLWWNPNENGWGISLTQQFGIIFAAWYVYDASGKPVWYVVPNCPVAGAGCTGALYQVTGGEPLTTPWNGTNPATEVGSITFAFNNSSNGTMNYTLNGIASSRVITRQLF